MSGLTVPSWWSFCVCWGGGREGDELVGWCHVVPEGGVSEEARRDRQAVRRPTMHQALARLSVPSPALSAFSSLGPHGSSHGQQRSVCLSVCLSGASVWNPFPIICSSRCLSSLIVILLSLQEIHPSAFIFFLTPCSPYSSNCKAEVTIFPLSQSSLSLQFNPLLLAFHSHLNSLPVCLPSRLPVALLSMYFC